MRSPVVSFFTLLILIISFGIIGCESSDNTSTATQTPIQQSASPDDPVSTISFTEPIDDGEWTTYYMQTTDGYWFNVAGQWDRVLVLPPVVTIYPFESVFDMKVSNKTYTEEDTGAVYRNVIIPKDSFYVEDSYFESIAGWIHSYAWMTDDAIGKLYESGGDVDISFLYYEPEGETSNNPAEPPPPQIVDATWGDGKIDPSGSLRILTKFHLETHLADGDGGENQYLFSTQNVDIWLTTEDCISSVDSSAKGRLVNRCLPDLNWDRIAMIGKEEKPVRKLDSAPMDEDMNGVWMGTMATLNQWFYFGAGDMDYLMEIYWVVSQR